ncbi:MAG: PRC-barrel domain-containing protein [Candidatus Eiseniibacteriota bacterium]
MQSRALRSTLIASAASIALAVGSASSVAGMKDDGAAPHTTQKSAAATSGVLSYQFRASDIIGKTVKNTKGETLGSVDDLVVSRDDKVVYAIVSVGGFLGVGDKLVAVRYDQLKRDGKDTFVYNATKEDLKARPAFRFDAADAGATDGSAAAYRERMAQQVDTWKQKVDDFSTKAKAKGTDASKSAANKLDRAWDDVKTQWSKLQNATDDSWDDTKAAFENAWRNFQDTWKSATSNS